MICDSLRGKFNLGNFALCWGNKPCRQPVGEKYSFGKNPRGFSRSTTLGRSFQRLKTWVGSPYENDFVGDLSSPLVAGVCGTARKCLTVRNPLLGFVFNAPSDSDTDLFLVTQHLLRDLLES